MVLAWKMRHPKRFGFRLQQRVQARSGVLRILPKSFWVGYISCRKAVVTSQESAAARFICSQPVLFLHQRITAMDPQRPPRVTISDVARHAGVSATTVSHALNGRGQVDPATQTGRLATVQVSRRLVPPEAAVPQEMPLAEFSAMLSLI